MFANNCINAQFRLFPLYIYYSSPNLPKKRQERYKIEILIFRKDVIAFVERGAIVHQLGGNYFLVFIAKSSNTNWRYCNEEQRLVYLPNLALHLAFVSNSYFLNTPHSII